MAEAASSVATDTKIVRRPKGDNVQHVSVDICVIGAGAAGASAALEAAKLGRKVALVDGLPTLGGQMVNSIIGTFCGLFANGTTVISSPTAWPRTCCATSKGYRSRSTAGTRAGHHCRLL